MHGAQSGRGMVLVPPPSSPQGISTGSQIQARRLMPSILQPSPALEHIRNRERPRRMANLPKRMHVIKLCQKLIFENRPEGIIQPEGCSLRHEWLLGLEPPYRPSQMPRPWKSDCNPGGRLSPGLARPKN